MNAALSQKKIRPRARRLANRERIYQAAVELFEQRGYNATTMDDIAERVGMVRASVFNHFPTKATFLGEFYLRLHAEVIRRSRGTTAASFRDRLRDFCNVTGAVVADQRTVMRAVVDQVADTGALAELDTAIDQDMLTYLGELTRNAAESGELREGVSTDELAELLLDLLTVTSRRWQRCDNGVAFGPLLWSRYSCLLDGVAS